VTIVTNFEKTRIRVNFLGVDPNESVVRLVADRARELEHVHDGPASCRAVIDAGPLRRSGERPYRVKLFLKLAPSPSSGPGYPEYMELHARDGILKAAVNRAFLKAEELLTLQHRPDETTRAA
jgi:hypothetical protein